MKSKENRHSQQISQYPTDEHLILSKTYSFIHFPVVVMESCRGKQLKRLEDIHG